MEKTVFTESELAAIRALNNAQNRSWWQKMTPEQRRAKRREYALNRVKRQQKADAIGKKG